MDEETRSAFADLKKDIKEYINLRVTPIEDKVGKLYIVVLEGNGHDSLITQFSDLQQEFEIHKLQERNCPLITEVNKKMDVLEVDVKKTHADLTGYVTNNENEKRAKKDELKEETKAKVAGFFENKRNRTTMIVGFGAVILTQALIFIKEFFLK